MQTILGSGGAIGIPLAKELHSYTQHIRLVSRHPKKINETDELFSLDAHNFSHIDAAIAGSEVVYVTIGFTYSKKEWQKTWPPFMQSVIAACKKHNARLVFLDNVYMYETSSIPHMTEESIINAPSEKGKIRQQLHEMIFHEIEKGQLNALIARAADFYGPYNKNSLLEIMVATNLMKGKKAQVFCDAGKMHNFTYTPDAAKAAALLGNTPKAFNQVWHVPTTKEKLTMADWVNLIATELKVTPKIQTVPRWMVQAIGLFVPVMRELSEMLYQYEQDYFLDSSKFEKQFGITATPAAQGVKAMIKSMVQLNNNG